ncbi:hypothetical protein HMPREF0573_10251 [Mobiluncus curtisii ATCC 43063]|uniref:Uncharacterized protein n=1 Tax=Mobiluncus curtisii (strain ATCC 43063 / DSM 2711 / V125) TaxID=548479 RepID=D6ZIM1_MOBCV|nr:hypothetical protein HMPREF0573_10251 [Mobiluncus curtisii ATCC 43063]
MRGPLELLENQVRAARLIPASAGTTAVAAWVESLPWAHPRECGDHVRVLDPAGS